MLPGIPVASAATTPTVVSLTFDNDTISEYTLGYQQALQPHGVNATFYVNSGTVGRTTTMSWSQLSTLAAAGSEIGGKTVDGTNLTTLTTQQQIAEICNDRQTLLQHGLKPFSFAYPGGAGASNTTIQSGSWWLIPGHAARPSSRRARWLVRCRSRGVPFQNASSLSRLSAQAM